MEYLVIDNFFDNPDTIRNLALSCIFYNKKNHPGNIGDFPGWRSEYINNINFDLYNSLLQSELEISKNFLNLNDYTEYWTKFSFSYTLDNTVVWDHVDFTDNWNGFKKFFGGIIYLTPCPPANSGTRLNKETIIDNIYNRYVMYDATKLHGLQGTFGNSKHSSRLVLTHFIYFK